MHCEEHLAALPLFNKFTPAELEAVAANGEECVVETGGFVYQQGEEGLFFYVVIDGEIEHIAQQPNNRSGRVAKFGPGGHFGEVALLTSEPHTTHVRAASKTLLIRFSKDFFHQSLLTNPSFHLELDKFLATRLRMAYKDHVDIIHDRRQSSRDRPDDTEGHPLIHLKEDDGDQPSSPEDLSERTSRPIREIKKDINRFCSTLEPLVIAGESGTGRRLISKEIHLNSAHRNGAYIELDLRQFDQVLVEGKLFGYEQDAFPFSQIRQTGIFEQFRGGTVVFHHAELLPEPIQEKILFALTNGFFYRVAGTQEISLDARLIFICACGSQPGSASCLFITGLENFLAGNVLHIPPLREHRRDIPRLIEHYLRHFSLGYNRSVKKISANALGILMNYNWPGNLTELGNVIQRAVLLAVDDEILSEQILLGLPHPEGKLEYNLLRLPALKKFLQSRYFPTVPKIVVSVVFFIGLLALFFGPEDPDKNIGLIMSWAIGWPLLLFSFFFFGRIWCSVCAFSVPGKLAQKIIKPKRSVPSFIAESSGWIMAFTCIMIFWVELVWNAYESTKLTGFIVLGITLGSFIFSILYERRAWCRYVCPLGGLNAIFSMPSVMELRANQHLCTNNCMEHSCYKGGSHEGCPMFRHPFLVDNNRDCILCANCIKNCPLDSIQINLRIAPQELWLIQSPRLADSTLVIALAAIYFPLARHQQFLELSGMYSSVHLAGSLILFGLIALLLAVYSFYAWMQSRLTGTQFKTIYAITGYGLIPLVLGSFLAVYFEMLIAGSWEIIPLLLSPFRNAVLPTDYRLLSHDTTATLQHLIILGGMLAALYATYRIVKRYTRTESFTMRLYGLAYGFLLSLGFAFLMII